MPQPNDTIVGMLGFSFKRTVYGVNSGDACSSVSFQDERGEEKSAPTYVRSLWRKLCSSVFRELNFEQEWVSVPGMRINAVGVTVLEVDRK